MIDIPDPPRWIPLEKYGIGIPFVLLGAGLWVLLYAAEGIKMMDSLTSYGHIGLSIVVFAGLVLVAAAGYTYSQIDFSWWLKKEERDAEPVTIESNDGR